MSGMCITSGCTTYIDGDDAICDERIAAVHHEAGAREERARICGLLREWARTFAYGYARPPKETHVLDHAADAIERGEHRR